MRVARGGEMEGGRKEAEEKTVSGGREAERWTNGAGGGGEMGQNRPDPNGHRGSHW